MPSGRIGAPLSNVKKMSVFSPEPVCTGSRTVPMTCPTAQSISST
eukprot:CAMPEP_0119070838 /NCGR_PEP_ID=MMETSP1178-20130426/43459_1 /TAXON_ID=33656 /ORGANISM="unid sp, Strain CCMP2000" /LENGTH=44 /DNA_ID= /DNA_START= /DNA_END= /DNA_ORIENTATION=